ncbi:MAG: hypothetical protein EGMGGAKC_00686 [Dehalococcoides mccartyi]|nr:hypothetical protein [Dehalococcoides mccartyi]
MAGIRHSYPVGMQDYLAAPLLQPAADIRQHRVKRGFLPFKSHLGKFYILKQGNELTEGKRGRRSLGGTETGVTEDHVQILLQRHAVYFLLAQTAPAFQVASPVEKVSLFDSRGIGNMVNIGLPVHFICPKLRVILIFKVGDSHKFPRNLLL